MSKTYEQMMLKRLREKLESSQIFLGIISESYLRDPYALLQLGLAVALNKPIYLLVRGETEIPENMKRLARRIERCRSAEDVELATRRLFAGMEDDGWLNNEPG